MFFSTLSDSLDRFRKEFPLSRVWQEDDKLIYKVPSGFANSCVKDANDLIKILKLPLIAKRFDKSIVFDDVFHVVSK